MAPNVPNVSERLAHAFAEWQTMYLIYEAHVASLRAQGHRVTDREYAASQRGRQLAEVILDNRVQTLAEHDWYPIGRFIDDSPTFKPLGHSFHNFARELFMWNRCSRRVYHLPHALEVLLASATFPDMQWCDVQWPFESFIITLEKPLQGIHKDKTVEYDTLVVTRLPDEAFPFCMSVRLLERPQQDGVRLGLTPSEMGRFEQLMKSGRYPQAQRLCDARRMETTKCYPFIQGQVAFTIFLRHTTAEKIKLEAQDIYAMNQARSRRAAQEMEPFEDSRAWWELQSVSFRIAVGWMLYLETLQKTDRLQRRPHSRNGAARIISGGAKGIITEPEHLFDVVGLGSLGQKGGVATQGTHHEGATFKRPHWRSLHWRRPRGSELDAEKTVRIPPKLVREDLVPLYGIIGGTKTVVLSE